MSKSRSISFKYFLWFHKHGGFISGLSSESYRHDFLCWRCSPFGEVLTTLLQVLSLFFIYQYDNLVYCSASVDGRVFVWKIDEGPDEEKKAQITDKIIIAVQIVGDGESYHPRICWHSHKQVSQNFKNDCNMK